MEVESEPIYPEKRLWTAVIVFALTEYEQQLQVIQKMSVDGQVSKHLLLQLRCLRYEVRHDWFGHVCENADVPQSQVIRKLQELDSKYKLSEIDFANVDLQPTRYQLRKAKRLRYA